MNIVGLCVALGLIILLLGLFSIIGPPAVTVGVVLLIIGVVFYFVGPTLRR